MKNKYSYFEQLCALNYVSAMANRPMVANFKDLKRCSDILSGR